MRWRQKAYLQCIPMHFGICLSFYWCFWLYCVTTVTPFIERSEGWSLGSVDGVLDQSQQECRFFCRNTNPLRTFQLQPKRKTSSSSLGDQLEKKIHNFPSKSSHLCRTSRHVWLSSSACDHCRAQATNLNYDNWHLHDRCQGGNDTSTRLLLCENRVLAPVV